MMRKLTKFSILALFALGVALWLTDPSEAMTFYNNCSPQPVPEPTTMLLLGSGLFGLALIGGKKFIK